MPALKEFVVEIDRDLEGVTLDWPERPDADDLEGNQFYQDMRGFDWNDVRATIAIERKLISDFETAPTGSDASPLITAVRETRLSEGGDPWESDPLWGLDPGVCSTVKALSAAGCIPYYSCNGGTFGDHHAGTCPIVAFFMRPEFKSTLMDCAVLSDVGIRTQDGRAQVYARDVMSMIGLAEALLTRLATDT